jgi:hypothetical protein
MNDSKSGKNGILIALIGAIAVVLAASIPFIFPKLFPSQSVVKGRVTDRDRNPIARATVKVDEPGVRLQTLTADNGDYVLPVEGEELKKVCHFVASASGYADSNEMLSPVPSQAQLNFTLTASKIVSATSEPTKQSPKLKGLVELLRSEPPTAERLSDALSALRTDPNIPPNKYEATLLLQLIGVKELSMTGPTSVSGILPTGFEVTLWTDAYGDKTKYSGRFGLPAPGQPYFGSNETYFTVPKSPKP